MPSNKNMGEMTPGAVSQVENSGYLPDGAHSQPEELVFAMDIGTRTVVGVAGYMEKGFFKVLATETVEHKNRAMLDGQVHDIAQVAAVAGEVKARLEKKLGITLQRVAIAAAGRVLKTARVRVERSIEQGLEITSELVSGLEMEAIQQAQLQLDNEMLADEKTSFYCVGYSVINYYLNGYVISALEGHKGNIVAADVLATFLPHMVVESLYTVMRKIGLEVASLTLEPIAAIHVTIPKDLRLLNLALVDIGAGTSDIAITKDGSIAAFAMVPMAGDEITEKIAQQYLVDFNTADRLKIEMSACKEKIQFTDIMGIKRCLAWTEMYEVVKSVVELLANTLCEKILEYNGKAPNAVFLVGGGSQVPGLTSLVAQGLGLGEERVAVRNRQFLQKVKISGKKLWGPEAITPIGIAVMACTQGSRDFLAVSVNGSPLRLFNSKKLTVSDALLLSGFNASQLIGRSGKSVSFSLNKKPVTIRGEWGKPAEIRVNGKNASLDTELQVNDAIMVVPAVNGSNAEVRAGDLLSGAHEAAVTLNGTRMDISPRIFINESSAHPDMIIHDGDRVEISEVLCVQDLARLCEVDMESFVFQINGQPAESAARVQTGDIVHCLPRCAGGVGETEIITEPDGYLEQGKQFPEAEDEVPEKDAAIITEEEAASAGDVQDETVTLSKTEEMEFVIHVNGEPVYLPAEKSPFIFVDIFNYIDFDFSRPQGNIVLKLNESAAAFTDPVQPNDNIQIYWNK